MIYNVHHFQGNTSLTLIDFFVHINLYNGLTNPTPPGLNYIMQRFLDLSPYPSIIQFQNY